MKYSLVIQALLYSRVSQAIMLRNDPAGSNSPVYIFAEEGPAATTDSAPAATPASDTPAGSNAPSVPVSAPAE